MHTAWNKTPTTTTVESICSLHQAEWQTSVRDIYIIIQSSPTVAGIGLDGDDDVSVFKNRFCFVSVTNTMSYTD